MSAKHETILQDGDKRLREVSLEIPENEITSTETKKLVLVMSKALAEQNDGVAIAAPQIGVNKRLFVVSGKIFEKEDGPQLPDRAYINPRVIKTSKKTVLKGGEGCLSCRWLYGKVNRHTNVTLEYFDETGKKHTRGAGGLLAHIFQHEVDHLDGILFVDKAVDIEEILPEDNHAEHEHGK
jgi:peptide deformylase